MDYEDFIKRATKTISKKAEIAEIDIEKAFCKDAKNKRCKALKLIYLNKKGFPDRAVLCPEGRIFFIEFKRKGKPLNPPQVTAKKLLESFGFTYHVCDVMGQAETYLDDFLNDF